MKWKKRGVGTNISEVMMQLTGMSERELTKPQLSHTAVEAELQQAKEVIEMHKDMGTPVYIVGDYDADGVTSSAILYMALMQYGMSSITVRLPKRESEGYGLKQAQLDEMPDGALLITVDNGIAAIEPIQKAIDEGHDVIVIDHHLPSEELPRPTVLVDPWLNENPFPYCGAGLAYKLALMLIDDDTVLEQCLALAAVGTVADVVPLIGDNRYIVKAGLANINQGKVPCGLRAIIEQSKLGFVDENSIGYKIGPIINATGRMADDGAMLAYNCLIETDSVAARAMAEKLLEVNTERKLAVEKAMIQAESMITSEDLKEKTLVLHLDAAEGILGVIAGRLAEKYHKAAICLAESAHTGMLKGSGRTCGTLHLKNALDETSGFLLGYGGHAGAVGLSLEKDNLDAFRAALISSEAMATARMEADDVIYYDLEIAEQDVEKTLNEVSRYAPFGEGCPSPVFLVKDVQCVAQGSATYQFMQEKHVKLFTKGFIVVGFDLAQRFISLDKPVRISAVGMLSKNSYNGRNGLVENTQMEALDIEAAASLTGKKKSPLAAALAARLA